MEPTYVSFFVLVFTSNLNLAQCNTNQFHGHWFGKGNKYQTSKQKAFIISERDKISTLKDQSLHSNLVTILSQDLFSYQKLTRDVTVQCLNDTEKMLSDLIYGEPYALKYLDADGKMPPGFLQGGWSWVGDYQECLSIPTTFNEFTDHNFRGKYFSIALYRNEKPINGFLPLMIGSCLPDSCSVADAHSLADVAFEPLVALNLSVVYVNADVEPEYDGAAIATFVIITLIGILVLFGTAAELLSFFSHRKKCDQAVSREAKIETKLSAGAAERTGLLTGVILKEEYVISKKDRFISFIVCFSFIKNTNKLLCTDTSQGPLACLNGLRVISMWWVIQGHTYEMALILSSNALYAQTTLPKRFTFQPIINGTFSVDTFFFLSGLLVAYFVLREIREKRKLSWLYFFLHRYWRLTPLYAFVLLVFMSLSTYLITGPYQWFVTDPEHGALYEATHSCRNYWWTNLLYINNFYPNYGQTDGCMGWGWYLANDMQFYIFISPILIILFKQNKIVGAIASVFLILSCIGIRAFLVSWYGIMRLNGPSTKHTDDPWGHEAMYVRPWARVSVYVVGFLTGYVLQHTQCRLKLNKLHVFIGWSIAIATALAVIYGMFYYNNHPGIQMTLVESGFYVSLCRTAWALSLSWLVLACASGHGGPVNWILSWKIWAPAGRLTYAAYLVHPIIVILYLFNLVTPVHFTDLTLIYMFVASLVFSYVAAYVVSMAVEAPMMAVEKLILNKRN